jgi:hypothetical protein
MGLATWLASTEMPCRTELQHSANMRLHCSIYRLRLTTALFDISTATYHQSPWSKDLLAFDGVNDGKVALCRYHHQDEDGGCVRQTVHELVHLAQGVT